MSSVASNIIHVVGDHFLEFRQKNAGVVLMTELKARGAAGLDPTATYIPGLGLSRCELQALMKMLPETNREHVRRHLELELASSSFTHKHHAKNILLSAPQPLGNDEYGAQLMVDDECAEMSDHITGQHLQGMLLMEAARQMMIAVTEQYLLPADGSYYFVFNSFEVRYPSFAFPIKTCARYRVVKSECKSKLCYTSTVNINFTQSGVQVCETQIGFSAYAKSVLVPLEGLGAAKALAAAKAAFQQVCRDNDAPPADLEAGA